MSVSESDSAGARTPRGHIIIVSGLPRSGTTMMMRMLEAGGLEAMNDNVRPADDSNPLGYYEDQRVKGLRQGLDAWLGLALGKVVKVVSPLLEYLPPGHSYKLIFMLRSVEEIVASQRQMLSRAGQDAGEGTDEKLAAVYRKHLRTVERWLAGQAGFDTTYVRYRDILKDPEGNAIRLSRFLGRQLDCEAMVRVVDWNLYRERQDSL